MFSRLGYNDFSSEGKQNVRQVRLSASNGTTFNPSSNNIVRIPITGSGFWAPNESVLDFTLNVPATSSQITLSSSAHSVIRRLRWLSPTKQTIVDIQEYGTWAHAVQLYGMDKQTVETKVEAMEGGSGTAGDVAGAVIATSGSLTVSLNLRDAFSQLDKLIPLHMIAGAGLELELELESANNIGLWDADNASYTVTNPEVVAKLYDFDEAVSADVRARMAANGGSLDMLMAGDTQTNVVSYTAATTINTLASVRLRSLTGLLVVNRKTGLAFGNHYHSNFEYDSENSYQFKFNGQLYPPQKVNVSTTNQGRVYADISSVFHRHYAGSATAVDAPVEDNKFAIATSFSHGNAMSVGDGLDALTTNLPLEVIVERSSAGSSGVYLVFGVGQSVLRMTGDGDLRVSK